MFKEHSEGKSFSLLKQMGVFRLDGRQWPQGMLVEVYEVKPGSYTSKCNYSYWGLKLDEPTQSDFIASSVNDSLLSCIDYFECLKSENDPPEAIFWRLEKSTRSFESFPTVYKDGLGIFHTYDTAIIQRNKYLTQ